MLKRIVVYGVMVLLAGACTRSGRDEAAKKEPEASAKKADEKAPGAARASRLALTQVARVNLTSFAASALDHVAVLVRFDRLRKTPLGDATEKLLSWLPDHARVVGSSGTRVSDVFELVLITSSQPSTVTATNMAALTNATGPKLRTMLDNDLSSVSWSRARGGAIGKLGASKRFTWEDPRVYLTPMSRWIVLTHPGTLGDATAPAVGSLDEYPERKYLPPWVARLPELAELGDSRLISMATLTKLPRELKVPVVGAMPGPLRTTIVLERHRTTDVWSGVLHFATDKDAALFASAVEAARLLVTMAPPQLQLAAGEVAKTLVVRHKATRVEWATRLSFANSTRVTQFAAQQVGRWARGWDTAPPAPSKKPAPSKNKRAR